MRRMPRARPHRAQRGQHWSHALLTLRGFVAGCVLVFTLAGSALLIAMTTHNFQLFTVRSGSMAPLLPKASVVAVAPARASSYAAGDVVTFRRGDGILVTHRVMAVESTAGTIAYQTKGDANTTADVQLVQPSSVIGHVVLVIPLAGLVLTWIRTPLGFALLVLLPATFVVLNEFRALRRAWRELSGRRLVPVGAVALLLLAMATAAMSVLPSFALLTDTAEISSTRVSVSDRPPRPSPTPEPSPSPRPSPTPEPSPSPRPSPTPEPSPSPRPSPTPEPSPSPRPSQPPNEGNTLIL